MITSRVLFFALILAATDTDAASNELKKFKADYSTLDQDLLNNIGDRAEVRDFVYKKDLATFTFSEGTIHMLRYVNNRPTTAIFVGKGNAQIDVPSHVERNSLFCVAKDSIVNEDFEVCLIRFGDDFDLKVAEQFSTTSTKLGWKDFNAAKKAQGEQFFRPRIEHTYDNYFQLLRSIYERAEDGYFFIDFNRYTYTFDPNQPEQSRLAYEYEGGDFVITEAAVTQRREADVYDDDRISDIAYPTTCLEQGGELVLGGMDGARLDKVRGDIKLLVNADSLKYVSLFLHHNLKIDSILSSGMRVDFHRRNSFDFAGLILPEYRRFGDTLELSLFYKGTGFDEPLPYVANPQPAPHSLTLLIPKGSNYYMPGMMEAGEGEKNHSKLDVIPDDSYRMFYFTGYVTGVDTVQIVSNTGIPLNILKLGHINKRNFPCYIPDELYNASVAGAFDFFSGKIGGPPSAFSVYVVPEEGRGMPGVMSAPQVFCVDKIEAFGGIDMVTGEAAAKLWFGGLLKPRSERELWVGNALPSFLAAMYVEHSRSASAYYSNLAIHRDTALRFVDRGWDLPLATGQRVGVTLGSNKGVWMMHMLRCLMRDLDTHSEKTFFRFLYELASTCNARLFSNADIVRLAEKHYGGPLDWFFDQWLYGHNAPEFDVKYHIKKKEDGYYIEGSADVKGVSDDYEHPVTVRVEYEGSDGENSAFLRTTISAPHSEFQLGPFALAPKKLIFNEFFSVLSKDHVKKL
jgi:hypothetical protein